MKLVFGVFLLSYSLYSSLAISQTCEDLFAKSTAERGSTRRFAIEKKKDSDPLVPGLFVKNVKGGRPDILFLDQPDWRYQTDSVRGLPADQSSTMSAEDVNGNLLLEANIKGTQGKDGSVGFAIARQTFGPEGSHVHALDNAFVPFEKRQSSDLLFGKNLDPVQFEILKEHYGELFGLQFYGKSSQPRKWRVVLETDVSKKISAKDGVTVTYEAEFESTPLLSYITLRLSDFKPIVRGQVRHDLPLLSSAAYPATGLNIVSFAFEATRGSVDGGRSNLEPIHADLTVVRKSIGFGYVFGMKAEETRAALLKAADLYEAQAYERGRLPGALRLLVSMIDRMQTRLAKFPELDGLKNLQTNKEKTQMLLSVLPTYSGLKPLLGDALPDAVVPADMIWELAIHGVVMAESGFFGQLHSPLGHGIQAAAMQLGGTRQESNAFQELFANFQGFNFLWSLAFDSRAGGVTDPASWRKYEMPESLPDPEFGINYAVFAKSPISDELQKIKLQSEYYGETKYLFDTNRNLKFGQYQSVMWAIQKVADDGIYQRDIKDQIIDSGRAIREGRRSTSYGNFNAVYGTGKWSFSFEETASSSRNEWERDPVTGAKGAIRIKDRAINRKTKYVFALNETGALAFETYRMGEEAERLTGRGFATLKDGKILLASQSAESGYPISETEKVPGFSQALKVIDTEGTKLSTTAVTFVKHPNNPDHYELFGEWDAVTSYRVP